MGEDAAKSRDPRSSAQRRREEELARQAEVASQRELNPYWRDGGDGKPTARRRRRARHAPRRRPPHPRGRRRGRRRRRQLATQGARRAKERAAEEGRSLADVVGDRWGSVAQLVESIGDRADPDKANFADLCCEGNDTPSKTPRRRRRRQRRRHRPRARAAGTGPRRRFVPRWRRILRSRAHA